MALTAAQFDARFEGVLTRGAMFRNYRGLLQCRLPAGILLCLLGCGARRTGSSGLLGPVEPALGAMVPASGNATGANLLKNGDFEEGVLSPWLPSVSFPAKATFEVQNGKACVHIESSGSNTFDILVRQRPVPIRRHREYNLRFTARSTANARLRPRFALVGSPPQELWSALVDVGPTEQSLVARIKVTEPVNREVEFVVLMGGALQGRLPATICLDNIAVEDPEQAAATAETLPRIRVNQVGYLPKLSKFATVKCTSPAPVEWTLIDASGIKLASGRTTVFGEDKDAGELVHQIDFRPTGNQGTHLSCGSRAVKVILSTSEMISMGD